MFFKSSPAGTAPSAPIAFNIKKPMTQESVMAFINENLGTKISLKKKMTTGHIVKYAAGAIAILGIAALTATGRLGGFLFSPWLAMTLSLVPERSYIPTFILTCYIAFYCCDELRIHVL